VAKQIVICQGGRGNLITWHIELLDEFNRLLIPTGGEPGDIVLLAIAIDLGVILLTKFQTIL
jgi:hypothetical protein